MRPFAHQGLGQGLRVAGIGAVSALLLAACSGEAAPAHEDDPIRLTVFAAQSLAESFEEIARAFEAERPGLDVALNLGGSSGLATQIEEGAPADVFASADGPQMERVASAGLIAGTPAIFARNALVVVVPAANRAALSRVEDLGRPGASVIFYQPDVPIGAYSRRVLDNIERRLPGYRDSALANVRSNEPAVRSALAKIELDEADAAFVYRTDAAVAGTSVRVIEIPESDNVIAEYPIGVVAASKERALAEAFVAFVLGPQGQRILREAGFVAPPSTALGAGR